MVEVFRPWFGRALTVAMGLIAVLASVLVLAGSGARAALQTAPWLALFAVVAWAVFWRPCVEVSDAGVRLVNVTRTVDVPWPALIEVRTKFALTLVTAYGTYTAWAAPAPSAHSAVRGVTERPKAGRAESIGRSPGDTLAASERLDSASGDAAAMVRRRWDRLRDAGHLEQPVLEHDHAPVTWHATVLALVTALVAAGVLGLLVS